MASLVMKSGAEPGREFLFPEDGAEVRIGRLPGLWITLLDAKASREHCRVFRQSTGWVVEDLGSRNGTYVNTQRIKKRLLQPGDKLRIGQTEFDYGVAAAPPSPGEVIPTLRSSKKPR